MIKYFILISLLLIVGCSQSLYQQGKTKAEQGQYDSAIGKFYEELKIRGANHQAWREMGIAYYQKDELVKAEDALKESQKLLETIVELTPT